MSIIKNLILESINSHEKVQEIKNQLGGKRIYIPKKITEKHKLYILGDTICRELENSCVGKTLYIPKNHLTAEKIEESISIQNNSLISKFIGKLHKFNQLLK